MPGPPAPIDLDRVPLGNERFSSIMLPDKPETVQAPLIFEVEDKPPYRVTLKIPQGKLDPKALNVAVVDSYSQVESDLPVGRPADQETQKVRFSHLGMVTHVLAREGVRVGAMYDVTAGRNTRDWDLNRMIVCLEHLAERCRTEKFDAVNISLATHRTVDELNKAAAALGLDGKKLTPENIQTETAHVWAILREDVRRSGADCPAAKYLRIAELLKKISDSGVPICIGAGNNKAGGFNLLAALVPEMIVVGGSNGRTPHKDSSVSSLNDTLQRFSVDFSTETGKSFSLEGTSVSAPLATAQVGRLRRDGLSVPQINELLRVRMEQEQLKEPSHLILFDLKSFEPLIELEKQGKLKDAAETLKFLDPRPAHTVALLLGHSPLTFAESLHFLKDVGRACDTIAVSSQVAHDLLGKLAKASVEERERITAAVKSAKDGSLTVAKVVELIDGTRK